MIDEAGILVREAVVILTPYERAEKVVERGDRFAPRDAARDFEPLRMLVHHGVDDVNKGFVATEEAVASGKEVAFEPALAHVLAEDLHDPAGGAEVDIDG